MTNGVIVVAACVYAEEYKPREDSLSFGSFSLLDNSSSLSTALIVNNRPRIFETGENYLLALYPLQTCDRLSFAICLFNPTFTNE